MTVSLLSPLCCFSFDDISQKLKGEVELRGGLKIGNHLFYMDDLKVIAESTEKAKENHYLLQREFQSLGMMINEAKCGVFTKCLKIPDEMNGIPKSNTRNTIQIPWDRNGRSISSKNIE